MNYKGPNFIDHLPCLHGSAAVSVIFPASPSPLLPLNLILVSLKLPSSAHCSKETLKEGKGRERGRGGEAEEKHWRTKQPDSPAVCKLIAHPPVTWQKREGGRTEKGRRKKINYTHTKIKEKETTVNW